MNIKRLIVNIVGWSAIACFAVIVIFRLLQFFSVMIELSKMKFYPEDAPRRTINSANGFVLLWSKNTEDGTAHRGFTQIFDVDEGNLVYITTKSINSIDYLTGKTLWTTNTPEDTTFHLYLDKLFALDSYDENVSFASVANISIPSKCNSMDRSTLRVYDPHTGVKIWEYSYDMVYPYEIFFNENTAFVHGLTIAAFNKSISEFAVDIQNGQIQGVVCEDFNSYQRIYDYEGVLSSNFYPITRDWEWENDIETPAYITDGSNLLLVERQTRQPLATIEFSGFPLNPEAVQLILHNNLLVIYLDDSNQFFTFQME